MPYPKFEFLEIGREDRVVVATLNNPSKLNPINHVVHDELLAFLVAADLDPECAVIVFTGAGRAFSSGGDVSNMDNESGSSIPLQDDAVHVGAIQRFVHGLLDVEKPMIAMVNGPAVGLGATFALFCDVVIASTDAYLCDRHVNVGLVAGDGGAAIWPLLIGINKAKEFLMTGRKIGAVEAERAGLINHVVPLEELRATTMELAQELSALPPYAVKATKAVINRQLRMQVENTLELSMAYEVVSLRREDHRQAARDFMAKRQAKAAVATAGPDSDSSA